jgi:hypothetical protein
MKAKIVTDKCHGGRNRKAIRVLSLDTAGRKQDGSADPKDDNGNHHQQSRSDIGPCFLSDPPPSWRSGAVG